MTQPDRVFKRPKILSSVEGEKLLLLAQTIKTNEVLTYEQVKIDVGVNMRSSAGRNLWRGVQRTLAQERKMQFACIAKLGYKRLDEDGKLDKSGHYIVTAGRRVRDASQVLETAERAALTPSKQLAYDVQTVVVNVMQNAVRPAVVATRAKPPSKTELENLFGSIRSLNP